MNESFKDQCVPVEFYPLNTKAHSPNYGHLVREKKGQIHAFCPVIMEAALLKKINKSETKNTMVRECNRGFIIMVLSLWKCKLPNFSLKQSLSL